MRNQCTRPSQAAVMRNGVAAIHRPAAGRKPALLKYPNQEILVRRSAGDVGLGLSPHVGWQRRRIIAQSNIWTYPQIECDRRTRCLFRSGFAFCGRDRARRQNQIIVSIEQH